MTVRGRYIALEGIEGAGKSTVAAGLAAQLARDGTVVRQVREPGGTAVGERIRRILLTDGSRPAPWTEAMLFAAARAQLAVEVIAPALTSGDWVVSDRTVYSSLAYQGGGRGLGVDVVCDVNRSGLGGVWPDLVVLLRLDPAVGLRRQQTPDRIGGEDMDLHVRVSETFDTLAAAEPDRFVVVDATQPLEDVTQAVIDLVCGRFDENQPSL